MNIGNNGTNWFQDDRSIDAYDQVSYTRGKHNIIAGIEFRKLDTGRIATNLSLGQFNFQRRTITRNDARPQTSRLAVPLTDITPSTSIKGSVAEWRDGFFVLDNWQATPKLTIELRSALRSSNRSLQPQRLYPHHECLADRATSSVSTATRPQTLGFRFRD